MKKLKVLISAIILLSSIGYGIYIFKEIKEKDSIISLYYNSIENENGIAFLNTIQMPFTLKVFYRYDRYSTEETIDFFSANNKYIYHTFLKNCEDTINPIVSFYVLTGTRDAPRPILINEGRENRIEIPSVDGIPTTYTFTIYKGETDRCGDKIASQNSKKIKATKAVYTVIMN